MSDDRRKTGTPATEELLSTSPFGGDLDTELTQRRPRRQASRLTLGLAAGVVLVAGVLGGIQAQKLWGAPAQLPRAGAPGAVGGLPGGGQAQGGRQLPGGGQAPGGEQAPGGRAGMTVGTVKSVEGGKVYVETAGGGLVTVTTTDGTTVQVTKKGEVGDLEPGTTVVVQGEVAADGTVAATSVNQGGGFGVRR